MRAEPVVPQDDVDVAVHVEDREQRLLPQVPELQQGGRRAERRASGPVGLADGGGPPPEIGSPRIAKAGGETAAEEAVRRAAVE